MLVVIFHHKPAIAMSGGMVGNQFSICFVLLVEDVDIAEVVS